jgi:NAD-dependent DNA ligase
MADEIIKEEIKRLRTEIEKHNMLYYELSNPVISDYEYDMLVRRLQELETRLEDQDPAFTHSESGKRSQLRDRCNPSSGEDV